MYVKIYGYMISSVYQYIKLLLKKNVPRPDATLTEPKFVDAKAYENCC